MEKPAICNRICHDLCRSLPQANTTVKHAVGHQSTATSELGPIRHIERWASAFNRELDRAGGSCFEPPENREDPLYLCGVKFKSASAAFNVSLKALADKM